MRKILFLFTLLIGISFVSQETFAQILDERPVDGIYADDGTVDIDPIPFPTIRKADVMWKKRVWREIDFRQKMNHAFYYPVVPHNNWRNFITVILDGMRENKFSAYDAQNNPTDEFLVPMSYNQLIERETDSSRQTLRRSYPPYDEYDTVIVSRFDPSRVMRLRVKEDWYFDKQRSQLMVRIIALCPVLMVERDGQEFTQPLFWISYDQARDVLAKSEIFNRQNSAERRTYDEVFWKRMFDSYVYKEENVYDRTIGSYALGIDALLESERVKTEILNFEQNLWEY
ncbi:MAG: gliding motility protein GldN [Bacteroidales bacterium]|jgi:gliding motility associated protien GldN|nr:gliding motility protein GldN [Bacteroidales bacterium]MDD4085608.1 gliding motility protein GldN [Bacteroidales bacterium]MDY0084316.1 gliding motility protein GldN [Bacteroidales bacterium]